MIEEENKLDAIFLSLCQKRQSADQEKSEDLELIIMKMKSLVRVFKLMFT